MIENGPLYQQKQVHDDEGPGSGVIIILGLSAGSGAVIGFLLAGHLMTALLLFVFSTLAACLGWLARGAA